MLRAPVSPLRAGPTAVPAPLHTGNLRYRYHISDGQISCDVSSIEVYFPESDSWQPLDFHKAYSTSFTFESSQNLVSLLPWASKMATGAGASLCPLR